METKAWAAIHRKHHARCETLDDPHSPQIMGIKKVLWQGAELYKKEAINQETLERFGQGTPEDWVEKNVYTKYSSLGIRSALIINLFLLGVPGVIVWAIQMAWIPMFAAGIINGVGHYLGYRNYECPDAATNISPWGFLIGGEELHNNHHTYPTSAKFSIKWWELDIGWLYIRFFSLFKLAKVKRVPPKVAPIPGKGLDVESLKAIITNRFQVMSAYSKQVIKPVFKQQQKTCNAQERYLLVKFKSAILKLKQDAQDWNKICEQEKHASLNAVYQFGTKLQEIWGKTTASQKELLDALQEWCRQAEATGIKYLQDFVEYLKSYNLARA
jgi:stearoyl-CoA desaturase (delta-9 desaturase)